MTHTVGMLATIELAQFRDMLYPTEWSDRLPAGIGGAAVGLLSRELVGRGRRLLVVTLDPTVEDEVVVEGPNLKICFGPYRRDHPAHDFFAAERAYLLRVLRREQPDIVHAQWTYENALAAQRSGLPHIITAHDAPLNVLRHEFIPYRIAKTLMAYRVLSRARRVVSVSPYVAAHLSRFMFYRGPREVVPNGMPESLFASRLTTRTPTGPLTFASILSGWGGHRNGNVAIEAFAAVRVPHPESRLIMFGRGHGPGEEAERWAKAHGLAAGIEFAGVQPYSSLIDRLARDVDVFVHPSLEDAQSMVLIEAMALGIPTIAGVASGGTPWTLDEGRAGVLVDVNDPSAVARAMLGLADSAEERESWGRRGLELATRRYHIRHVADAYERIYAELLDGR
jgi:glycosyltransferase involved in cell wall biosynthesis